MVNMRKRERVKENRFQLLPVWDELANERENGYKLFQSSPRDRRKSGDVLLPL